jgi:ABC-2 type transport system ATP-binding protein
MAKLVITDLSKTYPNGVKALDNINLEISNGMFGLLGPNGAGKSSLMRTIATLQEADSGSIMLNDIDVEKEPRKLRQVLGYLPQEFGVYPNITAYGSCSCVKRNYQWQRTQRDDHLFTE